jgi:alkylated DNA repair dioxygenase AlkB
MSDTDDRLRSRCAPPAWQRIELPAASAEAPSLLYHRSDWLERVDADRALTSLLAELPWQCHRIRMFGRELASPRLSSWHGDPGTDYRYSGHRHPPQPWTAALGALRQRLFDTLGQDFNAVLANLYRNGHDSMGWHADDEAELGPAPLIASISLGAGRRFVLRRRDRLHRHELTLTHGSLLLMLGATQHYWLHALPRQLRVSEARINLTFRRISPQHPRLALSPDPTLQQLLAPQAPTEPLDLSGSPAVERGRSISRAPRR